MMRLNLPDEADEVAIETFLASLREDAREGVRGLLVAGAGEAEVAEYIDSLDRVLEDEAEEDFEPREEEPPPRGAGS